MGSFIQNLGPLPLLLVVVLLAWLFWLALRRYQKRIKSAPVECPYCRAMVDPKTEYCPHCETRMPKN